MRFGRDRRARGLDKVKDPQQIMRAELNHGEKLIWADRSISAWRHVKSSLFVALFGIPFFGFAVFWTWMASTPFRENSDLGLDGFSVIFPLFGIPFLVVGAGLVLSPLWNVIRAKYVVYAMTDKRLVIRQGFPSVSVQSWPIAEVDSLVRSGAAEGPGDLYFAERVSRGAKGRTNVTKVGFIGIANPKRLEDSLRKQLGW